jgi:hypothetical protein
MLEKMLKKWLVILTVVSVITAVGIFSLVFKGGQSGGGFLGSGITLDKYTLEGYTASTTPKYQTAATSTMIMSVSNAKHIDLNINLKSTTTIPNLYWINSFSNDDGVNKNWYPESGYTATSNILETTGANPLVHLWTPAATSTVGEFWSKNRGVDPVASKYMRVEFWTKGVADLYVEGISQSDVNN